VDMLLPVPDCSSSELTRVSSSELWSGRATTWLGVVLSKPELGPGWWLGKERNPIRTVDVSDTGTVATEKRETDLVVLV
jgi:hypothetical protein